MRLIEPASWTEHYYRTVEAYFWEPQRIGRKSPKDRTGRPWGEWESKLRRQEAPLNHILNILFALLPQDAIDGVVSALLGTRAAGMRPVSCAGLDGNLVQPDLAFSDGQRLVFVEMKVKAKSPVDQFVKYAIAGMQCIEANEAVNSVDLVLLVPVAEHRKVWKRAKRAGLTSTRALRDHALEGLQGAPDVWLERGVPNYIAASASTLGGLRALVESMPVTLAEYGTLATFLREHSEAQPVLAPLIGGVLAEFEHRRVI